MVILYALNSYEVTEGLVGPLKKMVNFPVVEKRGIMFFLRHRFLEVNSAVPQLTLLSLSIPWVVGRQLTGWCLHEASAPMGGAVAAEESLVLCCASLQVCRSKALAPQKCHTKVDKTPCHIYKFFFFCQMDCLYRQAALALWRPIESLGCM